MVEQYPQIFGRKSQETTNKIFAEWLGSDGKAYIPRETDTIDDFVEAAKGSGTLFSVAHPIMNYLGQWSNDAVERRMPEIINSLKDRGFVGIESHYGGFEQKTRKLMVKLTRDAGMIPTGGSDYHGSYKPETKLAHGRVGDLIVPDEILDELKAKR
jgi:predicted metal-dependent phosphoesterase TrpH